MKLTRELITQISAFLRRAAEPGRAAGAAGVLPEGFDGWMAQGRQSGKRSLARDLYRAVCQATDQAHVVAEMAVYKDKPATWLKSGPGRDRPGKPGWSSPSKPL